MIVLAAVIPMLALATPPRPAVADVVAERLVFRPEAGETAQWRYRTTIGSRVRAVVYDARNLLVAVLEDKENLPSGDHRLSWDGRDDTGRDAPAGYYLLTIESETAGEKVVYDPTDSTGGDLVPANGMRYESSAGLVRYSIPRLALVRVQLGLEGDGPLLRTLVDWVPRGQGEYADPWDGWDDSHVIEFGESPNLDIQVWAYALPINAVVIDRSQPDRRPSATRQPRHRQGRPRDPVGTTASVGPLRLQFLDFPPGRPMRDQAKGKAHEMYNHWGHDRTRCHNLAVALSVPERTRRDVGTATIADDPLPIRMRLSPGDAAFVLEERFEVVIYLDGVFAFEEEQGYLPFTWTATPQVVPPGEHVVTFMVRGYEGHFGSASIRIRRPPAGSPGKAGQRTGQ